MQMKRAVVEWQIEGSLEIEVPVGSTEVQISKLARKAVEKEVGPLSNDITRWDVVEVKGDDEWS
ncbi:hypothetical protein [Thalassospira xiamenensis]|uniref:Uncharacterized protein n=1 Tax=Thalassospira xiamenensis TaxID=220697 RepID=A0A285TRE1_9PROT|nr:hypothetical protein [Thalassospira xiamenensis]SOC26147.1 hypothetical protein SAMN05428964_10567 [Thalassospira xiamenensis]